MTYLSHPVRPMPRPRPICRLARQSHPSAAVTLLFALASTGLLTSGCLLADPPEHEESERIPPILDAASAVPSVVEIVDLDVNQTKNFVVRFRSEDDGVRPFAVLLANYLVPGREGLLGFDDSQAPSTLDDPSLRQFSIAGTFDEPGCQQVTLLATYNGNLDSSYHPLVEAYSSRLTWWVDVRPEGDSDSARLEDCPSTTDTDGDN